MGDDGSERPEDGSLGGRDLIGIGGLLVASVVVGTVVGLLLDNALGTSPVFVLIGIALGIVGAGVGFWLKVRDALRS